MVYGVGTFLKPGKKNYKFRREGFLSLPVSGRAQTQFHIVAVPALLRFNNFVFETLSNFSLRFPFIGL